MQIVASAAPGPLSSWQWSSSSESSERGEYESYEDQYPDAQQHGFT
jgi:hypothetical protein